MTEMNERSPLPHADAARLCPLVDTHAHVNLEDFQEDLDALLLRSRQGRFPEIKGRNIQDAVFRPFIAGLVVPGVDYASSAHALEIARDHDYIYAAAAAHPNHVSALREGEWDELKMLIDEETAPEKKSTSRLVAIGETGLDRYWDDAPFEMQLKYFLESIEIAQTKGLPVIIHSRDANDDLDAVLKDCYPEGAFPRAGVVHSFSGTAEQAERWLARGFCLGFGGFVTYTNRKFSELWEVAARTPADRILIETDCPFLTPHPLRGKLERNEPLAVAFVARRLAELRGASVSEIAAQTAANAVRLFGLPLVKSEPEPF